MTELFQRRYAIRTFFCTHGGGNLHELCFVKSFTPLCNLKPKHNNIQIEILLEGTTTAQLRFSQCGLQIQRCGSGTLAVSGLLHTLQTELNLNIDSLASCGENYSLCQAKYWNSETLFGYKTKALPARPAILQKEHLSFFNAKPQSLFQCGEQNDYWLFVFSPKDDLRKLQAKAENICAHTQRAVIATQMGPDTGTYQLRYFAPQYGQLEDGATGSANIVAGNFWMNQLGLNNIQGHQVSADGGEFWLEKRTGNGFDSTTNALSIFGRCRIEHLNVS